MPAGTATMLYYKEPVRSQHHVCFSCSNSYYSCCHTAGVFCSSHLEVVRRQQHEEDDNQEGETVLLLSNKNEEMDRRLDQIDHRVDSLLARMDSFDQILMGASSRRKQRERRRERRRASMIY